MCSSGGFSGQWCLRWHEVYDGNRWFLFSIGQSQQGVSVLWGYGCFDSVHSFCRLLGLGLMEWKQEHDLGSRKQYKYLACVAPKFYWTSRLLCATFISIMIQMSSRLVWGTPRGGIWHPSIINPMEFMYSSRKFLVQTSKKKKKKACLCGSLVTALHGTTLTSSCCLCILKGHLSKSAWDVFSADYQQ